MSELINTNDNRATIRWKLLASVSATALIASAYGAGVAFAAGDEPGNAQIWIELGTQLERASGGDGAFVPDFYSHLNSAFTSPTKVQGELPWSLGPEAKISFQPENSNWVFSAGIRYGRASNHRGTHQQTNPKQFHEISKYYTNGGGHFYTSFKCCGSIPVTASKVEFADVQSRHQENHLVLDFQAGKDVGLGLFGKDGSSIVSAGVRIAQFRTKSDISVKARTDLEHYNQFTLPNYQYFLSLYPQKYRAITRFHVNALDAGSSRSFQGIGPSLSWDASTALAGNPDSSELTFDWGINAALLFGKQKTKTHHQSSSSIFYYAYNYKRPITGWHYHSLYYHPRKDFSRSRNVTVPNVGGMAGFSIKWPNAKISIGYRADYFFGAMDGGWDTYKKGDRSFMGPFASISFGLGG